VGEGTSYLAKDLYLFKRLGGLDSEWMVIGLKPGSEVNETTGRFTTASRGLDLYNNTGMRDLLVQESLYGESSKLSIKMEYKVQNLQLDEAISITLPYVPYENFRQSDCYSNGLLYKDYTEVIVSSLHPVWESVEKFLNFKEKICTKADQQNYEAWPRNVRIYVEEVSEYSTCPVCSTQHAGEEPRFWVTRTNMCA